MGENKGSITAADIMWAQAQACLDLAKEEVLYVLKLHESPSRRNEADQLHDSARKLARFGRALEADSVKLRAIHR